MPPSINMTRSSSSPLSLASSSSADLLICCCLSNLGRYPLSVILSFLTETDGCCLLLTRRSWARHLLPIFRLPPNELPVVLMGQHPPPPPPAQHQQEVVVVKPKHRHTFVVVPVQDAKVRLERLNTRRRYQQQVKIQQQNQNQNQNQKDKQQPPPTARTRTHQTTMQLAHDEWNRRIHYQMQPHNEDGDNEDNKYNKTKSAKLLAQLFPSPHLLRFLQPPSSSTKDPAWTLFQPGLTLIVSYPRSGNTLLRSYLERITGIVTGSDTRPDRSLSLALAETHGLVGEGICSAQHTVFCKTHWPERRGCVRYPAHRAIVLIRNPWDAIDSYWNLNVTNTHTKKVTDEVYQAHQEFYFNLIRNEMNIWLAFHTFWIQQQYKIPILMVRYEDLIENPQRELERILTFASRPNGQPPTATTITTTTTKNTSPLDASAPDRFWRKHIAAAIQSGSSHGYQRRTNHQKLSASNTPAAPTTKATATPSSSTASMTTPTPTPTTPKIGTSLRRYPDELIQELHEYDEQNDNLLLQLGYHVYQQGFPQDFYSKYSSSSTNLADAISISSVTASATTTTTTTTTPTTTTTTGSTCYSSSTRLKLSKSSLEINQPVELRPINCPYGRLMRDWRRARTKDDTEPFPTVGE
jgi:hypothetical protein